MADRSREEYAVMTGDKREISDLETVAYISEYDGNRYIVFKGYDRGSSRGGPSNDTYLVTSFKFSYILNKSKSGEN